MKKLSEIKLKDFHEMNEMEMKSIVGGSGSSKCDSEKCTGSCTITANGVEVSGECSMEDVLHIPSGTKFCACVASSSDDSGTSGGSDTSGSSGGSGT